MKKFKIINKEKRFTMKVSITMFIGLLAILFLGINKFERILNEQNLLLTKQAIHKAVIQCYANEGYYPDSLEYLEENYYLSINYDTYYVYYNPVASNLMPEVEVFRR